MSLVRGAKYSVKFIHLIWKGLMYTKFYLMDTYVVPTILYPTNYFTLQTGAQQWQGSTNPRRDVVEPT